MSNDFIDFNDLVGKPFKNNGRGPDYFDCWGGVIEAGKRYFIKIPDYKYIHALEYKRIKDLFDYGIYNDFEKIKIPINGDVAFFKMLDNIRLHFGAVVNNYYILHATPDFGIVIERFDNPYYLQKIEAFYRCKIL